MLPAILARMRRESHHFFSMPETARRLSVSYVLRSAAYPLLSLFTSAYIWQTEKNITLLILYYLGNFIVLPPVFMLNKWLLRHISLKKLYALSVVMTGAGSLMVVFYRAHTPAAFLGYGMLYGLANGIYWANRNFLTLRHTTTEVRSYFTGLQFTLSTVSSIVVPFIAGWCIVFLTRHQIVASVQAAYQLLVVFAFVLLLIAGIIVRGIAVHTPDLTRNGKRKRFSKTWVSARILSIALGCADVPLYVLPSVLILQALGNEGVLGSMSSIVSAITALITYIFGRKYRQRAFYPVFIVLIFCFIVSGTPLLFGISAFSVLWYVIIANLTDNLIWTANEPKIMDMMDEEVKQSNIAYYDVILDRELFLNIGRVGMYGLFFCFALIDQTLAMEITTVVSGTLALLAVLIMKKDSPR